MGALRVSRREKIGKRRQSKMVKWETRIVTREKWPKDFAAQESLQFHDQGLCCLIFVIWHSFSHCHKPSVKSAIQMPHVSDVLVHIEDGTLLKSKQCKSEGRWSDREFSKNTISEWEICLRIWTPCDQSHFIGILKGQSNPSQHVGYISLSACQLAMRQCEHEDCAFNFGIPRA